jgi:hypothetical protein
MKIRDEINKYSDEQYGTLSYESVKVWSPTEEGLILYYHYLSKKDK